MWVCEMWFVWTDDSGQRLDSSCGAGLSQKAVSDLKLKSRQNRASLQFVPDNWWLLEVRQQPPIIATRLPPSRWPKSHIVQFGTIAEHLKTRWTARLLRQVSINVTFNWWISASRNRWFIAVTEHWPQLLLQLSSYRLMLPVHSFVNFRMWQSAIPVANDAPCSGRRRRAGLSGVGMT